MGKAAAGDKTVALRIVKEQLTEAVAARKCHGCGCLQQAVAALSDTSLAKGELADILAEARSVFGPQQYDCLGCTVCYPSIAANVFTEAFPEEGSVLDLCPTAEPEERGGWPPLLGDYHVIRYNAPVAVCTLNSDKLASRLREIAPDGLAIAGTLHTENLGIERVIRNTLANPNIRFLILCGEDTRQAVGHLPGQSLKSLFEKGTDERFRIRGALGRRPVLKNVTAEQVVAFIEQVELFSMIGNLDEELIARAIHDCAARNPGAYRNAPTGNQLKIIQSSESSKLTLDPAGYFVIYPDRQKHQLAVEHYTNAGMLDCIIEGKKPAAIYANIIERQLITRLDHAAYLGRELARAENSLETGVAYIQDQAFGELPDPPTGGSCGCSGHCGEGND